MKNKFLLKYVGKLICRYGTLQSLLTANQITRDEEIEILDPSRVSSSSSTSPQDQPSTAAAATSNNRSTSTASTVATIATSGGTDSLADMHQAKTMLLLINNQLAMMRIKAQESDIKEQNKRDWHVVACAFDRLFLLIYTALALMGLFVIFV